MEIRRLGPQIGAEVLGVDVRALTASEWGRIHQAWVDCNVIVRPQPDPLSYVE